MVLKTIYDLVSSAVLHSPCLLADCLRVSYLHFHFAVTMQGRKEAPLDMQCNDKFLLQSIAARPGATTKDITPKMVNTKIIRKRVCLDRFIRAYLLV